jgi:hypothetical protein
MLESLRSGMLGFTEDAIVVVAASDLPALDAQAVDEFVDAVIARDLDVAYACLERRYHDPVYPEFPHTWARLRDGRYCGGGLVALRPRVLPRLSMFLEALGRARKSPLRLAGLFGWDTLARFAIGRLTIEHVERRASKLLGARAGAVRCTHPQVALNVDRIEDVARAALCLVVLGIAGARPAAAQITPAPPACERREANLGGIGRATVVAFTGPVFGAHVCATVANLSIDGFTARLAGATADDALVTAAVVPGGDVTLPLDGATVTGIGPYVVAPGGQFPSFGGDTAEAPRVVLAYAGQRVLVIGTTAVALVDLARILRTEPDLFGADAVERAVILASGPSAAVSLRTASGIIGAPAITAPRVLLLIKRG